jgi:hypothetical protein
MQQWVKEKLKQIADLYPSERIEKSKERINHLWQNRPALDRLPFTFCAVNRPYYIGNLGKEKGLRAFLDEFIARGIADDDFIPTIFPGCRISTIPAMFGAKEIIATDPLSENWGTERLLYKPEDIDALPDPDIRLSDSALYFLDIEKYFLEETEGLIPIHVCDMQGPVDIAGQLLGYDELFLCAFDDEDRYAKLMNKIVDAFIMLWKAQQELLGDVFVPTHLWAQSWTPKNNGVSASADSIVMVSPDFFTEFYEPYLKRITDTLGPLTIHSCGDFSKMIPTLASCNFIHGVQAGQMQMEDMIKAGWSNDKVMVVLKDIAHHQQMFDFIRAGDYHVDLILNGLWPANEHRPWTFEERTMIEEKVKAIKLAAKLGAIP